MKGPKARSSPCRSSITEKNKGYVSSNTSGKPFSSCIYVILFLLTYVVLPLSECSEFSRDSKTNHDYHDKLRVEEHKDESRSLAGVPKCGDNSTWVLFVKHFEQDWRDFNNDVTVKRDQWFEEKNDESKKLTKSMEDDKNKWFKAKDRELQILKKALEYKFASADPTLCKQRESAISGKPAMESTALKESDADHHKKEDAQDTKAADFGKEKEGNMCPPQVQQLGSTHQQQNIGQGDEGANSSDKKPSANVEHQTPVVPPQYQTGSPEHKENISHKYEKDTIEDWKKTMQNKKLKDDNEISKTVCIGLPQKSAKDQEKSKILHDKDKTRKQWDKVVEYKLSTAANDNSRKREVRANICKKFDEHKKKVSQKVEPQPEMKMQKEIKKPKYKIPIVTAENIRAHNAQQRKQRKIDHQCGVVVKEKTRKPELMPCSQKVPGKSFKVGDEKIKNVPQGIQKKYVIPKDPVKMQPKTGKTKFQDHSVVRDEMTETESLLSEYEEKFDIESVLRGGEVTETESVVGEKPRIPVIFAYSVKAKKNAEATIDKKSATSKHKGKNQTKNYEEKFDIESVLRGGEVTETESVVGEKPRIPVIFAYSVKAKKDAEATADKKSANSKLNETTPSEGDDKTETKPLEGDDKTETKPLEGDSKTETKPLEGDDKTETKPLEGDDKTESKPLEGDSKTETTPSEGDDKTESKPLEGDSKTETKPLEGDAKTESKPLEGDSKTETKPLEGDAKTESKPLEGDSKTETKPLEGDDKTESKPLEGDSKTETTPSEGDDKTESKPSEGDDKTESKPLEGDSKTETTPSEGDAKTETKPLEGDSKTETKPLEGDSKTETKPSEGDAKTETTPSEGDAKTETTPSEGDAKTESQTQPATEGKFSALKYFTTPEPNKDGEKMETKSVSGNEEHENPLYDDDQNSVASSFMDITRKGYMKYNKYSIPKETLKERENASKVGNEYEAHVLSEEGTEEGDDEDERSVYYHNQEGTEEGDDEDERSVYYHNQEGAEEGDGEDERSVYYHNQEGREGADYEGEADDEDEGSVYYHNQEYMEEGIDKQMRNMHEGGMTIKDPNNQNLEHEQGKEFQLREPQHVNNVHKQELVLSDYKEWLDQKENPIVRTIQKLWDKFINSNFMIWRRYKGRNKDIEMPTNPDWENWMKELKNEWSLYNAYIHNERIKWFREKEIELGKFIEDFQFKWMHYNTELLEKHSFDVYKKSQKWDDSKWIKWIERDGESIMIMDIEKWLNQSREEYNLWQLEDWEQWKNNKILDWLLSEKKCDQYQYWLKWEYSNKQPSLRNEKLDWYTWKKIRKSEAEDWQKWVHEKDQILIQVKNEIWESWKEKKKNALFSMLNHFINNWIIKKQWKVWILDLQRALPKQ
eukprot:XP_002259809.1 hypothetical protein, conserved in Plasmodium species [Plasmodium knowlesi strain H]